MDVIDEQNPACEYLPIGSLVAGRYQIEHLIGAGGMGAVYHVKDRVLGLESVALKVLHRQYAYDQKYTQRFLREVQLMRRVNQANVVRTFDVGADQDLVYFTMEYIEGQSLLDMILDHTFPKQELSHILIQICEALEAIHEAGIVHRDLKPENILLLKDNTVKITDFGVARPEQSDLTSHNEVIGSSSYIAPEIWAGNNLTAAVDLYSLGIILYELACGELPFDAESPAAIMRQHMYDKPVPPKEIDRSVPRWLNRLVMSLLEKEPQNRLQNAREVIDYVRRATEHDSRTQNLANQSNEFLSQLEAHTQRTTDLAATSTVRAVRDTRSMKVKIFGAASPPKARSIARIGADSKFGNLIVTGIVHALNHHGHLVAALTFSVVTVLGFGLALGYWWQPGAPGISEMPNSSSQSLALADSIAYVIESSAAHVFYFILFLSLPALFIGALSKSWKTMWLTLLAAFIFQSVIGASMLGYHLYPLAEEGLLGEVDPPSLIRAARATQTNMGEIVTLRPYFTNYKKFVVGDQLFIEKTTSLPVYGDIFLMLSLVAYICFLTIITRKTLGPRIKRTELIYACISLGLLSLLTVQGSIQLPAFLIDPTPLSTLDLGPYSMRLPVQLYKTCLFNWAYLALVLFVVIPLLGGSRKREQFAAPIATQKEGA